MFSSNSKSISAIHLFTIFISIIGLFYFDFTINNFLIFVTAYFLYSGIGVSMMLHRYYTHRSFEFKNIFIKWLFTFFAITSGRGGILGWVYIHRLHHLHADTKNDPHAPSDNKINIFFPSYLKFDKNINLRLIKDILITPFIVIDKYYVLLILVYASILFYINPVLFYFGWILPVMLTHFVLNSFLYFGHNTGYRNFNNVDKSKNIWLYSILLWGEGWHNNHHNNPSKWHFKFKKWEIDIVSIFIRLVKK